MALELTLLVALALVLACIVAVTWMLRTSKSEIDDRDTRHEKHEDARDTRHEKHEDMRDARRAQVEDERENRRQRRSGRPASEPEEDEGESLKFPGR